MAMFVHLTTESRILRIRRSGIARVRKAAGTPQGVYAVPVTRNFYASHQWLRELKRRNQGPIAGVYFRVPDEQRVWIGHYGQAHRIVTAAEAIAQFSNADDPAGWEVVVPRRIEANEIHKTRQLPQLMGWRFFPPRRVSRLFAPASSALVANLEVRKCDGGSARLTRISCPSQEIRSEPLRPRLSWGVSPVSGSEPIDVGEGDQFAS